MNKILNITNIVRVVKYLFPEIKINYLVLKIYFKKNRANIGKCDLIWRSWSQKNNGAIEINFECTV